MFIILRIWVRPFLLATVANQQTVPTWGPSAVQLDGSGDTNACLTLLLPKAGCTADNKAVWGWNEGAQNHWPLLLRTTELDSRHSQGNYNL